MLKRIFLNLTHGYRVKRSWLAPYVNHPPMAERTTVISPIKFNNPMFASDEDALNSLLNAYR